MYTWSNLISLYILAAVLIWRLVTGNYGIGGEIFIPAIVPLIKLYWEIEKDICPYDPDEEEFED